MDKARILGFDSSIMLQGVIHTLVLLLNLILIGLLIYCMILFIIVARKGIIALNLYISSKKESVITGNKNSYYSDIAKEEKN